MTARDDHPGPPALGDLERLVMEEAWGGGERTVREVLEALNAGSDRQRAYTTVMTIMRKLDRKGLLTRRRAGKTDFYVAVLDREAYLRARASSEVEAFVREYGDVAYASFARQMERLSPEQREQLERLAER